MRVDIIAAYKKSKDMLVRRIDESVFIIPVSDSSEDQPLYQLGEVEEAIYNKIDGQKSVADIVNELTAEFIGERSVIEKDVVDFMSDLLKENIIQKI